MDSGLGRAQHEVKNIPMLLWRGDGEINNFVLNRSVGLRMLHSLALWRMNMLFLLVSLVTYAQENGVGTIESYKSSPDSAIQRTSIRCNPDTSLNGTQLEVGASPVVVTLTASDGNFVWSDSTESVYMLNHRQFALRVDRATTFVIEAESDERRILLGLMRGCETIQAWGWRSPNRPFRERIVTALDPNVEYRVVVGSGTDASVKVRVGLFREGEMMKADPARRTGLLNPRGVTKGAIEKQSPRFAGVRASFYGFPTNADKRWVQITATSERFDPTLFALDSSDLIVAENDDRRQNDRTAELVFAPDKPPATIGVSYFSRSDTLGAYEITVKSYAFDPRRGYWGVLEHYLGNPVFAFLAGLVASVLLSQLFFNKQFKTRRVGVRRLTDQLVINEDVSEDEPLLRVAKSDEPLRCASLVVVDVSHGGQLRIGADLVREPLKLSFKGIKRILSFRYDTTANSGWEPPVIELDDPVCLRLPFQNLDPRDRITLSVLCEQTSPAEIHPLLRGQIAETVLLQARTKLESRLWRFMGVSCFIAMLFAFPLLMVDLYLDFLPDWAGRIVTMSFYALTLLWYGTILLTFSGRQWLKAMIRFNH